MLRLGNLWREDALYGYERRQTPEALIQDLRNNCSRLTAFQIHRDPNNGNPNIHQIITSSPSGPQPNSLQFTGARPNLRAPEEVILGWYVHASERAQNQWNNMKYVTERRAQENLDRSREYRRLPFGLENRFDGEDALWALRGYFVGPDTANAPPYVVVLCSRADVSKLLVDAIGKHLRNYPGWYTTRLPMVDFLQYYDPDSSGRSSAVTYDRLLRNMPSLHKLPSSDRLVGSPSIEVSIESSKEDDGFEEEVILVNVGPDLDGPTMANGGLLCWLAQSHRCGHRIHIMDGSEVIARAALGGIIKLGGKLYGLTVAHIFLPRRPKSRGSSPQTHRPSYDEKSGAAGGSTSISGKGAHDGDSEVRGPNTPTSISDQQLTSGKMSLELDWALIQLPLLPEEAESWDDLNIVKTTSGNFSPTLVDENEPVYGKPVVLATPGCEYGLQGRFMGSEAVVNIPGCGGGAIPVWVLRMEKPLLIEPGDSGSWVCDAFTGDLIGILVAGCPELLEAYVIPAYRVFDDIRRRHIDMDFGLPSGRLLPRIEDRSHLSTFFKLFRDIEGKLRNIADTGMSGDWQGIKDDLNKVEVWRNGLVGRIADSPNQQERTREKDRDWTNPRQLLVSRFEWELTRTLKPQTPLERFFETYLSLEHPIMEANPEDWAKALLRKPPRRRYDYMSKAWRDYFMSDKFNISIPQGKAWDPTPKGVTIQRKQVLHAIWDHLISENNDTSGIIDFKSNKLDNIFDLTPNSSYSTAVPCYLSQEIPRDRLGLCQSLEVMTKDLEKTFDNIVRDFEIVANGIGPLPTVHNGGPVNLIGVVLTNEDGSRVAALLPPSSLGSHVSRRFDFPSSREIPTWIPEAYLERKSNGRITFACSQLRLPLSVSDSKLTIHDNIKRLFRDHLQPQTSISDSDQFLTSRKIDWNRDSQIYYFREQNRNVLIDFHEVILPVKESELQYTNSKGWIVTWMGRDEAERCYDWDAPFFNVFQPTGNEDNNNSTDNNVFAHAPTDS